ncbi:basic proline-rich protein-like [Oenanthe melanoleuca]|uniref:basic proline-rich protein-like n=1 Tax=Oenanthe melanoleuca TaxID=2939378 RepID=UPI0024C1358B|nr:basic proline-rich protein-like [Oenanthe melanoleuca]
MAAPPPSAAYPGRRRPALRARPLAGCSSARAPIGRRGRRSPAQRPFQARLCSTAFGEEPPVGHQHARTQRSRTPTGHPRPSPALKQVAIGGGDSEPERQRSAGPAEPFSPFPGSPSARTPRAAGLPRQDGAFLSSASLAFLVKARAAPAGRRLQRTTPTALRSARAPSLQPLLLAPTPAPARTAPLRTGRPPRSAALPRPRQPHPPGGRAERRGAEGPLAASPSRCPQQPGTHLRAALPPSLQPPARRHRLLPPDHPRPAPPDPRPARGPAELRDPPEPLTHGAQRGPQPRAARPGPSMRPRVCLFMSLPDGFPEIA